MAKKYFDVKNAWDIVCADELAIRRYRARKCVQEPIIAGLFIFLTALVALPAYYMFMVEQVIKQENVPMQLPWLWQINEWFHNLLSGNEKTTFYGYAAVMVVPPVVCVIIGLPWRLISKIGAKIAIRPEKAPIPAGHLESLEALNRKIAQLESSKSPDWGVIMCFGILGATLLGCILCLVVGFNGKLDAILVLVMSIVLQGLQFGCSVMLGSLTRLITFCREPDYQYMSIAGDAAKALSEARKVAAEAQEEQERQAKYAEGSAAFFAGDYKTAKTILDKVHFKDSADAEALVLLSSEQKDISLAGVRKTYGQLWNAWEKGFRDPRVREATKTALDAFVAVIDEAAQPDLIKAYACFLTNDWNGASDALAKHVKYSYPDAVALDIVCRVMSDRNDPDLYPEWLKALKTAKQRRISDMYIEICDELIGKMEVAIRQNEQNAKRRAEERKRREALYTPLSTCGGIPTWAEPSGWTDFRTGEPLYRVNGRIVNANGEEVSPAWWE